MDGTGHNIPHHKATPVFEYLKLGFTVLVTVAGVYVTIDNRLDSIERHLTEIETRINLQGAAK